MSELAYLQRRCAQHEQLAAKARSLPAFRAHLAFVRAYRARIAELMRNDQNSCGTTDLSAA